MLSRHRHFCVALLFVLLVCLTAVSVHVATHASLELQSCELCSGHADPSHAIPVADVSAVSPVAVLESDVTDAFVVVDSFEAYFHQRAPPDIA